MAATPYQPENSPYIERSRPTTTALIVGHSRHPSSVRALTTATDLARRLDAHLHVVHAIALTDYPPDSDAADWEQQGQQELDEQRHDVEIALADAGVPWTYHCYRGDPAAVLAATAEEHDALLIIVGTRGEGLRVMLPRLTKPSVSHGLIRRQARPVLVVPAAQPA
jgi:nucleotide-binding universal stress UspA family protein